MDLYSHKIVGWSMKPSLALDLIVDAVMIADWKSKPKTEMLVQSDQGSQYGSDDWRRFSRDQGLTPSRSRRGNCWDNAVAESFFSSLKKERVGRGIYKTRDEARAGLFDYVEML